MLHSHDTWRRISIAAIFAAALIGICTVASAEDPGATPDAIKDRHPYAKEAVEHYNKAVKLHENGFVNQAVIEYESAIAADNRMEEAYCNVGVIYSAQHKYDKALDCFQKALSLVPDRVVCLNGLGTVLVGLGRNEEAIETFRRIIEIDPDSKSAYYNLELVLKKVGRTDEAQKVLKSAPRAFELKDQN